ARGAQGDGPLATPNLPLALVPGDLAHIDPAVQRVTDGGHRPRGHPARAPRMRGGGVLAVQRVGGRAVALPAGGHLENRSPDGGLARLDDPHAVLAFAISAEYRLVAVPEAHAVRDEAGLCAPLQGVVGALLGAPALQGGEERLDGGFHLAALVLER